MPVVIPPNSPVFIGTLPDFQGSVPIKTGECPHENTNYFGIIEHEKQFMNKPYSIIPTVFVERLKTKI